MCIRDSRNAIGQDSRATKAHQRQRQSLGRQQPGVNTHVDETLNSQPETYALRHNSRIETVEGDGLPSSGKCALTQPVSYIHLDLYKRQG